MLTVLISFLVRGGQEEEGANPVVLGRLGFDAALPTVVIHGHYDVQPADEPDWTFNPFHLTGEDGFLYGRGVSDCKGPILAAVFAAALASLPHQPFAGVLSDADKLGINVNIAFVLEGEGENSSIGLQKTILSNMDWFQNVSVGVSVLCACVCVCARAVCLLLLFTSPLPQS